MTPEEMISDVQARLTAIGEQVTEERISGIIGKYMDERAGDPAFVRKMRFGGGDPALVGSKFARWNLQVEDIEFAYDLFTARHKAGMGVGPSEELTKAFNDISDAHYMSEEEIKRIDGRAIDDLYPRINKRNIQKWEAAYRAMDTAESGYGSQLIGAQYVGSMWEGAGVESNVFSLIKTMELTAPTAYIPVRASLPEMLLVSESTASNSSNYTTTKTGSNRVSVTPSKFVIHEMWSGELEEDSIIPFVAEIRAALAESLAQHSDSLILNGDTTNAATGNINLDDADPADTKHYLAFDGVRHAFLVDATGQAVNVAGAVSLNTLRDLRGLMVDTTYYHDWGHPNDRSQLVFVADYQTADRIALLDEIVSAKIQSGNSADLLNGQVASILGHPVISSIRMSLTEADGKVSTTGSNNVKGQVAAFNRKGLVAGWRRRVKLETERVIATDQTRIVASLRLGLGRYTPTGAASGIKWVAGAYNITL